MNLLQKHEETAEWTVNYRIYLPAVYGMEPVGTFFVKERIENQAYNSKNAVNLLLSKFSSEYAWADASILMDYLRGDIRQQAFFKGKLVANGQDVFAARLLALSDWNATLKQLTQNACSETLIKAQILAPFSEQLSELVYDYAKHEPELKAKINLICYLYIAGFAQLTDLINEVLSEQKDLEDLSIMTASQAFGANRERDPGTLTRIWNGLPTETSNRTIQNGWCCYLLSVGRIVIMAFDRLYFGQWRSDAAPYLATGLRGREYPGFGSLRTAFQDRDQLSTPGHFVNSSITQFVIFEDHFRTR